MTLALPDRLPTLAKGKRPTGSGQVCAEQAVNWLVSGCLDLGDETDHPSCVHPVLNALSIKVNDLLPDDRRGEMWPLILAQPGTARPDMEPGLSVSLAKWCARTAGYYGHTSAARASASASASAAYAERAYAHPASAAYAATWAHRAATYVAGAAARASAARAAAYAAGAYAKANAGNVSARADALLALLAGCQAEHARLTGHIPDRPNLDRLDRLATLVGARRQST